MASRKDNSISINKYKRKREMNIGIFIFAIVFAVGGTNRINLRNYARSYFCWLLITVVLVIILLIVGFAIAGSVYNIFGHSGYYHYYM